MDDHRESNGRFAQGNTGGPGRPRRTVEQDYVTALCQAVPINAWLEVIARALEDAKAGDAQARQWLSRYLLGNSPASLFSLAVQEQRGRSVEDEISIEAVKRDATDKKSEALERLFDQL